MNAVHPAPPFKLHTGANRRHGLLVIACAHMALIWGLWQLSRVPLHQLAAPVLSVFLLPSNEPAPAAKAAPAPEPLPRPAAVLPPPAAPIPVPVLRDNDTAPTPPTAPATVAAAETAAPRPVPQAAPAPPAVTPPTQPAPPPRRQVSGSAVRYLSLPPVEVPRASRRAGEHGTVWLKVVVDAAGLPVQVSVQRSSGFARLDEQALWAMRQARFKPHTEDGRAVEVEVIAPIEYPAD